jgi:AmmeMemoRadiSam system protein B
MREPFALCRKAFATPLGALEPDVEAIDRVAEACSFDAYADQFNHKREHSLEFQAVFLKHVLGDRKARIVPVLAGIGRHQARGTDPSDDRDVRSFLEALQGLVASRPGRTMLVAGADFAHVGPRFGDEKAYGDRERETLERTDRASLACAEARDARAFWSDVARDLDSRRVCGLAPIYTLLEALPGGVQGETLHYEQTVDDEDGSIVSHAAVAFYAA